MNPFLLGWEARLTHWKQFRRGLVGMDLPAQLAAVAKYWSVAPLGNCAYDTDTSENWACPWDLLYHNQWCRGSVAIGMENTLRLAGVNAQRLKLQLIADALYDAILVLIVDDTYVLNYGWGEVRRLPLSEHTVLRQWQFQGRHFISVDR